ncbi:hypothetical protein [Parasutterella sp.]|uniref:hypothetical protein n=1 Tax=Parasutterella sp. TaxID=2049037 RepID=UPI0035219461
MSNNIHFSCICGIDIAKKVMQVFKVTSDGVVTNTSVSRKDFLEHFRNIPPALIGMEACATSIATLIPTGAAASDKELLSKFRLVVICLSLTMWLGSLLYIPNFWESQRLILCATKTQQYEQRQ